METKLAALKAELDIVKEMNRSIYEKWTNEADKIINKWFVEPHDAVCIRRWLQTNFDKELTVCFEIGFYNTDEDRVDFGSDVSFYYEESRGGLRINHGCIGSFNKSNIYQFKRAKLIGAVIDHINDIENEFSKLVCMSTEEIISADDAVWKVEHEVAVVESDIHDREINNIISQLNKGAKLEYTADCPMRYNSRLFHSLSTVVKITPKFVTLRDTENMEFRVRLNELVSHIYNNYVCISED